MIDLIEDTDPRLYYRPELTPASKVAILRAALAKLDAIDWLLQYEALRQRQRIPATEEVAR